MAEVCARRRFAAWAGMLALVLLVPPDRPSRADDAPRPDADETRLREIVSARLAFSSYVFSGDTFPKCEFENPGRMRELIGPYQLRTRFYWLGISPVQSPKPAVGYHAVVEVEPESGRPMRRRATLFKALGEFPQDWRPVENAFPPFVNLLRLRIREYFIYSPMVQEQLRGRTFAEFSRDPAVARLLAGLEGISLDDEPVRKVQDAVTRDRQKWVTLKAELEAKPEHDENFQKPFVGPRPIEGKPATVLHVGTLAEAGFKPGSVEKIDAVCREWAENSDQAFAVCVARHGAIVLHQAYGTRDGQPMTVDTKSWMASITKTMSATLMMMLVDQGLVDLDAPVDRYLPAFRGIKVKTPLTVRHLYTHTGGLSKWPSWPDELPDVEDRVADYYDRLEVGKEWAYTGMGYTLGGKIIENLTGEAVPLFFRHHLLELLGCPNTEVYGTHADARSVPLDMAKFGQMLLNGGAYGRWRFFSGETFEKMLPERLTKVLGPDTKKIFGIGLDGRRDRFGHGAASAATFSVDRTNDLVVIVCRNKDGKNWDKYQGKFWEAVKAGMDPPFKDRAG